MSQEPETYLDIVAARSRNQLLLRDAVGKARETIYDIPKNLTFGVGKENVDQESAGAIINVWKPYKPSVRNNDNRKNYVKWNAMAAAQNRSRHASPSPKRSANTDKKQPRSKSVAAAEKDPHHPSFTHGRRKDERPPTPIDMVVGMTFARNAAKEAKDRFEYYENAKKASTAVKHSGPTKASLGHAAGALSAASRHVDTKTEWVLSKFKNVKGRLNLREYLAAAPKKSNVNKSQEYI